MLDAFHGMVQIVTALLGVAVLSLSFGVFRAQAFAAHRPAVTLLVASAITFYASEFYDLLDVLLTSQQIELARDLGKVAYLSTTVAALLLLRATRRELGRLRQAADTDDLTQVYTAGAFRRLAHWRFNYSRQNDLPLALLMLDLDAFKSYNDTYGHEAGNVALQRVARVMRDAFRAGDILARYGGDEFAALVHNTRDDALHLAERIRREVEQRCAPGHDPSLERQLTISVGVSILDGQIDSLEQLIEAADAELYRAKEAGRNLVSPSPSLYGRTASAPRPQPG